ncbi:MAG: hypothetical protein HC842_10020 [Cytophagales bacterium]|nr:hypothetical protein [Cytophagales bacterium]
MKLILLSALLAIGLTHTQAQVLPFVQNDSLLRAHAVKSLSVWRSMSAKSMVFTFDRDGLLRAAVEYHTDGQVIRSTENNYDAQGRLETQTRSDEQMEPSEVLTQHYYDPEGRLSHSRHQAQAYTSERPAHWTNDKLEKWEYDAKGQALRVIIKDWDGQIKERRLRYNGLRLSKTTTWLSSQLVDSTAYRYGPRGKLLEETLYNHKGMPLQSIRLTYKNGRLSERSLFRYDYTFGSQPLIDKNTQSYSYDDNGLLKKIEDSQGVYPVVYEYYEDH